MPAARYPELSHMSEHTSSKRLFSNSSSLLPSVLISVFLSFALRGFHFCLCCSVLCAALEVVKGQLDLPSPLADSRKRHAAAASELACFLQPELFSMAHPQHSLDLLLSDSPQQCTPQGQCLHCSWSLG